MDGIFSAANLGSKPTVKIIEAHAKPSWWDRKSDAD